MHKPTVCVFHENDYFVRELTKQLSPHHLTVRHYHFVRALPEVLSSISNALCCVVQADFDSFPQLEAYRELLKKKGEEGVPIYFLSFGEDIRQSLVPFISEQDKLYHSNIRIDRLAVDILNLAPCFTRESRGTIAHSAYGKVDQFELPQVLEFLQQQRFSGKLCLNQGDLSGVIALDCGRIVQVDYKGLPLKPALSELLKLGDAIFHLEQRIPTMQDIVDYTDSQVRQPDLSLKDILIDLFYFMHNHFFGENTRHTLKIIIEEEFGKADDPALTDLFLLYDSERQEKLQIIGEIGDEQVRALLDLFQQIYCELSGNSSSTTFNQFASSLRELRPYLLRLNAIRPLIEDDLEPAPLPSQNHQSA